jgi:RNA polymerase sigma factor (sigma-70 family)
MDPDLSVVKQAIAGDRAALDCVVEAIKDDVYGLALRMLAARADAEDATQEVLIKIVTHLSQFRGESSFRTWAWRIAANHVLSMNRGSAEREEMSFERLAAFQDQLLDTPLSSAPVDAEKAALEEEVKVNCTTGMLLCLDREHRIAYVLGEVLGLSGDDGAAILDIDKAAFRKRLQRARGTMRAFMEERCGIVNQKARCRCTRLIEPGLAAGVLEPGKYTAHPQRSPSLLRIAREVDQLHASVEIFRSHPDYAAPESVVSGLRALLDSGKLRLLS